MRLHVISVLSLVLFVSCGPVNPDDYETMEDDHLEVKNLPAGYASPPAPRAIYCPPSRVQWFGAGIRKLLSSCGGIAVTNDPKGAKLHAKSEGNLTKGEKDASYETKDKNGVKKTQRAIKYTQRIDITVNISDASTGNFVLGETVRGTASELVYDYNSPDWAKLKKKAFQDALLNLRPKVQEAFPLRGRVVRMKGGRQLGFINVGRRHGVQVGMRFSLFREYEVDVAGQEERDREKVGGLKVARVDGEGSWCEADADAKRNMLIGLPVVSLPQERSLWSKIWK